MARKYLVPLVVIALVLIGCRRSTSDEKRREMIEATGNVFTLCAETKSDMGETYTPTLRRNGEELPLPFLKAKDKVYCRTYSVSQFTRVMVVGSDIERVTVSYMAVEPHGLRTVEVNSNVGIFDFEVVGARSTPVIVVAPRTSNDPVLLPPGVPR
jgi:hypothetical protein